MSRTQRRGVPRRTGASVCYLRCSLLPMSRSLLPSAVGVLFATGLLALAAGLLAACSEAPEPAAPEAYTVRGLYLGTAFDSAAVVVSHEAIPGVMEAMRMRLRVRDRAELRGLRAGDKIRFTLADDGSGYAIEAIVKLPPDTPLALADTLGTAPG